MFKISIRQTIVFTLLVLVSGFVSSDVIELDDVFSSLSIDGPLETLSAERSQSKSSEDWLESEKFSTGLYKESQQNGPNIYWHRIHFLGKVESVQSYYLVIESAIIQELDLFLYEGRELIQSYELGIGEIPKQVQRYRGKFINFELAPDQELTLLIRKYSENPAVMPMTLYSESGFEQHQASQNMFWGAVIAVLAVVAIYNFIISLMTRSKSHGWYLLLYTISFFYFSALHGYGYLLWPLALQVALTNNLLFLNFVLLWVLFLFSRRFLEIKENAPWHYLHYRKLMLLAPLGALLSFVIPEYIFDSFCFVFMLLTGVFLISMAWAAYRNKFRPARFYIISWFVVFVGSSISMASFMGFIAPNFFAIHGFLLSTTVELILLSVALADGLRFAEETALAQAYIDPRSGLPNYSYFRQRFPSTLNALAKNEGDIWMLMIKPLGIEYIISLLGPDGLSRVYRELAKCVQNYVKTTPWAIAIDLPNGDSSYLFALHGNQFLLLARENRNIDQIATDFLRCTEQTFSVDNLGTHLSFQLGMAKYELRFNMSDCYRRSQLALLDCRNNDATWKTYSSSQDKKILDSLVLIADLRTALQRNELSIVMQPQFDMDNHLFGAEVLVRWRHSQKGMISPADFIPLAEQTLQVFEITRYVMSKACEWLQHQGGKLNDFRLSINLSALDVSEPKLLEFIQQCITDSGVSAQKITFELTETAMRKNSDQFVKTICELQAMGFQIALDDFGTGYSSMSYIQEINADEIKIDIAFVRNVNRSEVNQKIIRAIVQIAKSTQAYTVAEGIETQEELAVLKELGVDYFQGYLLGRPIASEDFHKKFPLEKIV
ncbi:MAG: hypothetical protein COC19_00080 [SAR86 cluster bacterium]|uniref:EAL domain-containing protein n=1 Tax=SAR86 cluster bacterium TaxID=2030880 RepID=A0A2A4MWF8_9GAMM|nr:MAG: hypothetical protein COC19_00080 [SAR86 cluster bacterium]